MGRKLLWSPSETPGATKAASAASRRVSAGPSRPPRNVSGDVLDALPDGEFVVLLAEVLFQNAATEPAELEAYAGRLRGDRGRRDQLIRQLVIDYVTRARSPDDTPHDPDLVRLPGTSRILTRAVWEARAAELPPRPPKTPPVPLEERRFRHTGVYRVSAIASLYRGRRYLETFLENMVSQTIFDQAELIIIDANSPEGEEELIRRYQAVYPNIVYRRMNYRIGIYDAWNEGVRLARGAYLTNTNLDDLRRRDSFELQAAALDAHGFADIVYQDVYYSFDGELDFDTVAAFGFRSDLPIVTPNNLLYFNAPHNAPMWRAALHPELGLFDITYRSAGDYEFWLRCAAAGKAFFKINEAHVVYFQNPEGLSTAPETRGVQEWRRVRRQYARRLISPFLTMSDEDFAAAIGGRYPASDASRFAQVQGALRAIKDRF
nr:glycosyltransferase [Ancylobacter lacus]